MAVLSTIRAFLLVSRTAKVAAALSAAVTITKLIGEHSHFQAEPPMQKQPRRTPTALRERGSGGEALLSEKRPLPQNLPLPLVFRGGSAREETFLQKSLLPCNHSLYNFKRVWIF